MADDDGTTVTVETPAPNTDSGGDSPDVVVIESGNGAPDLAATVADHGSRIGALEVYVQQAQETAAQAQATADTAEVIGEVALDVAGEAVQMADDAQQTAEVVAEDATETVVEEDTPPAKTHWLDRPLFGRRKS